MAASDHGLLERFMAPSDKRKQSLYFPVEMLKEIEHHALRQDRSVSWIVQQAWKIARPTIDKMPSPRDVVDEGEHDDARDNSGFLTRAPRS
jgi:uncharacterized small protein (TIGR04563 family)